MELRDILRGRNRVVNVLLAVGLALVSIRSLRNGRRLRGLLAGAGAVVFGVSATTGSDATATVSGPEIDTATEPAEPAGTDTATVTEESTAGLTCETCGEPILPGQRRGPNEDGVIVHDDCV